MKAFVDRFEGEVAVLVVNGRARRVPRAALPRGTREGDLIDLAAGTVDREATRKAKRRTAARRRRLIKKKARPPGDFDL